MYELGWIIFGTAATSLLTHDYVWIDYMLATVAGGSSAKPQRAQSFVPGPRIIDEEATNEKQPTAIRRSGE